MKKTLIVLMLVLLSAVLVVSCDNNANKTITITYDLNGGKLADGVTNPSSAKIGETITLNAATKDSSIQKGVNTTTANFYYNSVDITRTYTFKGWKVKGSADSTASESYTAGTEDVTLVAVWDEKKTYSNGSGIRLKVDSVSAGSKVTLGKYSGKDIEWTVLKVDTTDSSKKKALLIASDIIVGNMNHRSDYGAYSWSESLIKAWFDNTGDKGFLSQCDLKGVKMVSHTDSTVGTVFVLSKSEFENEAYNSIVKEFTGHWWLRDVNDTNQCWYVMDGTPKEMNANFTTGVRPAFWIECR